ncbi:MAG: hypothetical protein CVV45_01870 [Spirochaetae bacterium HGW-Spirochaetae-10]|nr:MAG: hypothetical protein CVV45_01870 [Spirochaetae bacterium HGW-Spirochaetae-10]
MEEKVTRFTVPGWGGLQQIVFILLWLPYAIAPLWLMIEVTTALLGGKAVFYYQSGGVRHDGVLDQILGYSFLLACSIGIWYHCAVLMRSYILRCGEIIVSEDEVRGCDSFDRKTSIKLSEIESLDYQSWPWNEWRLIDSGGKILYPAATNEFGAMLELILDRAENIKSVSFGKESILANIEVWRKKPDVELIERVRRRAEENRKKMENTTA